MLVSAEAFDMVAPLFETEETAPADTLALIAPVVAQAGWLDPSMDTYDVHFPRG